MRGSQRVSRYAMFKWRDVHKSRAALAIPLRVPGKLLGRELHVYEGTTSFEAQYKCLGSRYRLFINHY